MHSPSAGTGMMLFHLQRAARAQNDKKQAAVSAQLLVHTRRRPLETEVQEDVGSCNREGIIIVWMQSKLLTHPLSSPAVEPGACKPSYHDSHGRWLQACAADAMTISATGISMTTASIRPTAQGDEVKERLARRKREVWTVHHSVRRVFKPRGTSA